MSVQQVLVFRRDLKHVRRGKMLSQAGHSSMMFLAERMKPDEGHVVLYEGDRKLFNIFLTPEEVEWFSGKFTKISLVVDGEAEMEELYNKAKEMGLTVHKVVDAGLTEFAGVPTLTCIAIGPHEKGRIDPLTGKLSLF
jgi:peptidyl-tRNA hydrolase